MQTVQIEYAGHVEVSRGTNPRELGLYAHQNEAIIALEQKSKPFEGLLVLPTGGGKTLTAVHWLLRNFIARGKKVLWIAHRHELLDQALETLIFSACSSLLGDVSKFNYRVISGHPRHGIPVHIQPTDDIIIASKNSLNNGLNHLLNNWVRYLPELLLVVDEAHHATAKTYRKLIDTIKDDFQQRNHVDGFNMLGLTATPFRTNESEKGLLNLVFPDGIIFSEHLKTLIIKGILAEPIFEQLETKIDFSVELTTQDIKVIENFDNLPRHVAERIASSRMRNRQIVDHYIKNRERYKPLLVFAVDINHAIVLNGLFQDRNINSAFIVSEIVDLVTGRRVSQQENSEKIKRFKNGEIEVLINVQMLTEGTDLPNIQTIFLTRPTTSTILMTQMIGRALRGQEAGGTEKAYLVSFIDNWEDKINWVNPEKLHKEDGAEFIVKDVQTAKSIARLISIEKMEEFARIIDQTIDTTALERLEFLKRVPVGIYRFSILEPSEAVDPVSINYDVLLYDDTDEAYDNFINDLETLFCPIDLKGREILTDEELHILWENTKEKHFPNSQFLIGYRDEDVKNILRFYAQKEIKPEFLAFSDRRKCNTSTVARYIYDNSLGGEGKDKYIDSLWDDKTTFWQVLFGYNKLYFRKQLDIEDYKRTGLYGDVQLVLPTVIRDDVPLAKLPLNEIKERDQLEYRKIKNAVFAKRTDAEGFISCAISGFKSRMRRDFQIDHIKPMSQGGLTTIENLQVLSHEAHKRKTRFENASR